MANAEVNGSTVLRRRSWPIFFGIVIVGSGIGMGIAVCTGDFRTGWQGIPIYFAIAGILGRLANCKIVLRHETLFMINPLRTHVVPKAAICAISVSDDETLKLETHDGREIPSFAFGGSLVDRFRGTSKEAERNIELWRRSDRSPTSTESVPEVQWTWCKWADLCILLCISTSAVGALWMMVTAST